MAEPEYRYIACSTQADVPLITITESHLRESTTCYAVRDEILSALDPDETENVLVDLQHVEFMGSIGFLVFVGLRRQLWKGRVVLCCLSPPIHDAFLACHLISADPSMRGPFEVAASVELGAELVAS